MTKEKIERINFLARKSRTQEGLTKQEQQEQALLRKEYIDAMKASLKAQLDCTILIDEKGNQHPLTKKQTAQNPS